MASAEKIGSLIAKFEAEAAEAQADVAFAKEIAVDVEADIKAAEVRGFDEGLAAANQLGGSDAIYSDAQMIQYVAEAKAEVRAEYEPIVAAKDAQIVELEAQVEAEKAALVAFKLDLLTKYEEQQVVESSTETGFKDLLKV